MYKQFAGDPNTLKHLPDIDSSARLVNRQFICAIISTLHPDYFAECVNVALDRRMIPGSAFEPKKKMLITDEAVTMLLS